MTPTAQSSSPLLYSLGIDVHSDNCMVAGRCGDAPPVDAAAMRQIKTQKLPRTRQGAAQILEFADKHLPEGAQLLVVMESTGSYSLQLASWLKELRPELRLAVVNPLRIKKYIESTGVRNKTDRIDARLIACYGAERKPAGDEPVEAIYRDLRALSQTRLRLMDTMQALENQRQSVCAENLSKAIFKEISKAYDSQIRNLRKQMDLLEKQMKELIRNDPQVKADTRLMEEVLGIGFLTAAALQGECGNVRRFRSGRQLTAFCGMNPEIKKSGKWVGQSHLSKSGSSWARRALYMAALSVIGSKSEMGEFYERLVNEGKKEEMVALAAVMRKLLVTMRAVVVKGEKYDRYYQANSAKRAQERRSGSVGKLEGSPVENSSILIAI